MKFGKFEVEKIPVRHKNNENLEKSSTSISVENKAEPLKKQEEKSEAVQIENILSQLHKIYKQKPTENIYNIISHLDMGRHNILDKESKQKKESDLHKILEKEDSALLYNLKPSDFYQNKIENFLWGKNKEIDK